MLRNNDVVENIDQLVLLNAVQLPLEDASEGRRRARCNIKRRTGSLLLLYYCQSPNCGVTLQRRYSSIDHELLNPSS